MEPAPPSRLGDWLAGPAIRAIDPERIDRLRASLAHGHAAIAQGEGGSVVGYDPGPGRRRLVAFDRRGHLTQACRWRHDGALDWAACLTAHGAWIGVEPRAEIHPALGAADRLWRMDAADVSTRHEALTLFQAVDYARPELIPPLLEPGRLPPGAGTAVLNLMAALMSDQGVARARYRGPYPTEQLFTALLECFRYDEAGDDPLGRFMDGGALDWRPAPYESHRVAPGVVVQHRHAVDKVVLDGVAFYRRDWQGVIRHEPRLVREAGPRVCCSLWALGRSLEDRLVLDPTGEVLERPAPARDRTTPAPLPPVWRTALAALIARDSAPALAEPLREALASLALEWGPVAGDLLGVDGATVRLSGRLREAGLAWVREAASPPERARRAMLFVLEVARLLAPTARLRAQARLLALDPAEQARALEAEAAPASGLPESVGRLVALIAGGGA